MPADTRTYRFTLFVNVEPGHPAFDDPEWAADAAWGTLTNEYGLRAIYADIEDVRPSLAMSVSDLAIRPGVTARSITRRP